MNSSSSPVPALLLLVVLYRQMLSEAATVRSVLAAAPTLTPADTVLIWDNSPEAQPAAELEAFKKRLPTQVQYRHHPENTPLSRVYNEAVATDVAYEVLVFLDQDSSFDGQYVNVLRQAANGHPAIQLFAPLIRVGDTIVSPGHFKSFKGKYWTVPAWGKIPSGKTVAVMSGLALRKSFFKSFGAFDERFRLYGIDTNLMLRHAKLHPHFYVLNVPFGHDLSQFRNEEKTVQRARFEDFRNASLLNAELLPLPARWLTRLFLTYRRLKQ